MPPPTMILVLFVCSCKITIFVAVWHLFAASSTRRLVYEYTSPAAAPRDRLPIVFVLVSLLPMLLANPLLLRTDPWVPLGAVAVQTAGALGVLLVDRARAIRARREPSLHLLFPGMLLAFLALYQLCFPQIIVCPLLFPTRRWTKDDATLWVYLLVAEDIFCLYMFFAGFVVHHTEVATRAAMLHEALKNTNTLSGIGMRPTRPPSVTRRPSLIFPATATKHTKGPGITTARLWFL